MKISLPLENGYLPDKYSKFAADHEKYKNQPVTSFPIEIADIPDAAQTLCISLVDYDAIPVCGFPWIHWVVANIPVSSNSVLIPENFSIEPFTGSVQGKNSQASIFVGETDKKITEKYTGPTPPDRDHTYTLTVNALPDKLDLQEGFWWNEVRKETSRSSLDQVIFEFVSKA